jgi:hypothetical protein
MLLRPWKSSTALTLAVTMASSVVLPLSLLQPATAATPYLVSQRFPDSWRTSGVPAGTVIPVQYEKNRIILEPNETVPVTLTVARDITSTRGDVLIPEGSKIKGKLKPTGDGTQFVAETLTIQNRDYNIDAVSEVINRRETITRQSDPKLLEGAAIGGGAATVLGAIFGKIQLWQVLGGAGVGALASVLLRGRNNVEVISIDPNQDLALTLRSNFEPDTNSGRGSGYRY